MKKTFYVFTFAILFIAFNTASGQYDYEASSIHPFGLANPAAPKEIKDFNKLIGKCQCRSVNRNQDQTWADTIDMVWTWRYIMNGMAVQDETLKLDGKHSGSIRQYHQDSAQWYVHYYSSNNPSQTLSVWTGNKKEENIVLYREQSAPTGQEGYYRLTFFDINDKAYKWVGEWVDLSETIVYPTWKISCKRE